MVMLRDTCDILIEVAKVLMSVRIQHGKRVRKVDSITSWVFLVFTLSFAVNQLYYYPLFGLYHLLNMVKVYQIQTAATTIFMSLCLVFLLLDLLWFTVSTAFTLQCFTPGPLVVLKLIMITSKHSSY